eukprot:1101773-Pleurochrysis_carterae.AAC.1
MVSQVRRTSNSRAAFGRPDAKVCGAPARSVSALSLMPCLYPLSLALCLFLPSLQRTLSLSRTPSVEDGIDGVDLDGDGGARLGDVGGLAVLLDGGDAADVEVGLQPCVGVLVALALDAQRRAAFQHTLLDHQADQDRVPAACACKRIGRTRTRGQARGLKRARRRFS